MSKIEKELKKIMTEVGNNLNNQEDVKFVEEQICNIYNLFIQEFEELEHRTSKKMDSIALKCKKIEAQLKEANTKIERIENDIYVSEDECYDFTIRCPYCKTEIEVDCSNEAKDKIICPECDNEIELDWNEHEENGGCSGNCHECDGDCLEEEDYEDM